MKALLIALILIPSVGYADSGLSMSYRSIPAYVKSSDGSTQFRTIETTMATWFMDDTIKGRDSDEDEPISWLGWLDTRSGAGYTFALNFVFGSLERKVDIYGIDVLIGKRLFIIPHLVHVYGKLGPSYMAENWNDGYPSAYVNSTLGAVAAAGMQIQVLKGIKIFTEAEFRGYGPLVRQDTDASITMINKMPFVEKEVRDYYENYDRHAGRATAKDLVRESLRFCIRFTF